jgi:hypothetical protein
MASTDLALVGGESPSPVASMSVDALKTEAVNLKLAIDKGENVMREWRIRLGEVLIEIQERLKHGEWVPYVREHLTFGEREAQRYQLLARNAARVSLLPAGLSMREELLRLREPKALPRQVVENGHVDGEAPRKPLLRYCPPDMSVAAVVEAILLTSFPDASTALDVTYGPGNFWKVTTHVEVTAHDLDPSRAPDGPADFTDLEYDDATFDVVLFDPPHIADAGEDSIMGQRFGTVKGQDNLEELIMDGVRECWRVCDKGLVVKVTDHTHGGFFQAESDLVSEALGWKQPLYDVVHHVRERALVDPRHTDQYSAYSNGSMYLILRKGDQQHRARKRED